MNMDNYKSPKEHSNPTTDRKINEKEAILDNIEIVGISSDNSEMTEKEFKLLTLKINAIEKEVRIWRKKREELNSQVIEKSKIRNQLNIETKTLIKNANEEKKLRNEKNTKIAELKLQKQIIDFEIKENEKHFESAESKLETVVIPKNMNSQIRNLQKEIKDLEWRLQTQTFNIEDERRLVDKISLIDQKMEGLSEFKNLSKEKVAALNKLRKFRRDLRKIIKEMNLLVKDSRNHHKNMLESFEKANNSRKQADTIHSEIQKIKAQADLIHSEYVEKIKTKRILTERIRVYAQKEKEEQQEKVKEIKKEKTTIALQKSKDGKKISFDEFKSLIDRGMI